MLLIAPAFLSNNQSNVMFFGWDYQPTAELELFSERWRNFICRRADQYPIKRSGAWQPIVPIAAKKFNRGKTVFFDVCLTEFFQL